MSTRHHHGVKQEDVKKQMAFTRKFLKEQGVPEDKIDTILAERNRSLNDYVLKSEVDEQIRKAVEEASKEPVSIDVKTTEEYKALENRVNMYSAFETKDFTDVKKPYKEIIWNSLDHSEKHVPYEEQMVELKTKYPDMFNAPAEETENKPLFGGETNGSLPSGEKKESFSDYWGYSKK